jgi:hypothetical protein
MKTSLWTSGRLSGLFTVLLVGCAGGVGGDAADATFTATPLPPPWSAAQDAGTGLGGPPLPPRRPDVPADASVDAGVAPRAEVLDAGPSMEVPDARPPAPAPSTAAPASEPADVPAVDAAACVDCDPPADAGAVAEADAAADDAADLALAPVDALQAPDAQADQGQPPPPSVDACSAEPTRCDVCTCRLCGERWAMCFADAGCAAIIECSQRTGCFGEACVGPCGLEIAVAGGLAVGRAIEVAECSAVRCGRTEETCSAADPGPLVP